MPSPRIEYAGADLPEPRAWTRPTDRPTIGPLRSAFARIWMGKPLLPWQQLVSDVAGELDPDTMLPWYDMVVTAVQRQAGKTHLSLTKTCERCVSVPGWRAWYTAQTGQDARDAFLSFDLDHIDGSPLRPLVRTLRGNGHEVMQFPTRSTFRPHPPTEKALHGKQSDENDIDEAWAHSLESGLALMQAVAPTQLTRPAAQTWVWSAGGTAESTWLAELIAAGRAGADTVTLTEGGPPKRVAFFEWGIPDDMDVADLAEVASYHPAVGHTQSVESLRKLRTAIPDDDEFARAAGNRWTSIIGGAINAGLWRDRRYTDPIPDDAPVAYGAARSADGSEVVVVAAGRIGTRIVCEVIAEIAPAWGAETEVRHRVGPAPLACSSTGPSAPLADALTHETDLRRLTSSDEGIGVSAVLDGMAAGQVWFRPHAAFDGAAKVIGTRSLGDGGKTWAKVRSGSSIAALEAASSAVWLLLRPAKPAAPAPKVRFSQAS